MTDPPDNRYIVPGLERGLAILQLFGPERSKLGAADVARALNLPRTTVFRLMQTLSQLGFLERHDNSFRLGPAVLRLGFEYLAALDLPEIARPVLDRLRERLGYPAQVVIRDGREVVVIVKSTAASTFSSNVAIGSRLPAHATVLGRVMLADLAEADLRALYPEPQLISASPKTPRDLSGLIALLHADRQRGYAISEAYYEANISGVAAPIRDERSTVVAALSVVVPRSSLDPVELRAQLITDVTAAALEISERLNYRAARLPAKVA